MATAFRRFTKRVLIILNIIVAAIFLLACLAPYLDTSTWWFMSLLALGFPFLLIAVILFFIFWLFVKFKYVVISVIALLIGWKNISRLFAVHPQTTFNYAKSQQCCV